jgi:hypothetical protein
VDRVISTYSSVKERVVISTNSYVPEDLKRLEDAGFNVIINPVPKIPGKKNFNNQVINTYRGCLWAKDNGFTFCLKMRVDLFCEKIDSLIDELDGDSIYFSAYHNYNGGYLCEHMVFGDTDFMLRLWNIPESSLDLAPEIQLTNKFNEIRSGEVVKYIFPILFERDIIVDWPNHNKTLSSYKTDKLFIYEKY